jgi:hypothetical protein
MPSMETVQHRPGQRTAQDTRAARSADMPLSDTASALNAAPRVQGLMAMQAKLSVSAGVANTAARLNRTGLPDGLKAGVEARSGISLDSVRVHYNSTRPAQLQAHAFTQGTDIHVAPGGERHLPHEAWHVVQQAKGRVPATTRINGVSANTDPALETEADQMGARAIAAPVQRHAMPTAMQVRTMAPVAQRMGQLLEPFMKIVLEALTIRFPDLVGQFVLLEHDTREAAVGSTDEEELELAEDFLSSVCAMVLEDEYIGGVVEALDQVRQTLRTIRGVPSDTLAALSQEIDKHIGMFRMVIQQILLDAKAYVETSKEEFSASESPDIRGAAKSLLRPSSKAHYLNAADDDPLRPISHGEQDKASLYHRSAKHPLYSSMGQSKTGALASMTARNPDKKKLGSGGAAHLGLYPNAFTFDRNLIKKPPAKAALETPETTSEGDGALYDRSLNYRLGLCRRVVQLSSKLTHLRVGVFNDYPLIMVHFSLAEFVQKYFHKRIAIKASVKKSFTAFLMNYFTGILNFYSQNTGLNISMAERSSFGFLTPSIAETAESFRINTGLMPPIYAEVLARALHRLNAEFGKLLEQHIPLDTLPLDIGDEYLNVTEGKKKKSSGDEEDEDDEEEDGIEEEAQDHRPKSERYADIKDALALAVFPIEKRGKSSITNAVRNRASLDFVNASAFNALAENNGFALGNTLAALLSGMQVAENGTLTTIPPEEAAYAPVTSSGSVLHGDKAGETAFTELLAFLRLRLLQLAQQASAADEDDGLAEQFVAIVPLIYGDSPHLELALELMNELILVHAIKTAERQEILQDGYGSGSDVEEDEDDADIRRPLRGTKIITHNGMRALISSIKAGQRILFPTRGKSKMTVWLGDAYYEVEDALKLSNIDKSVTVDAANILITDINACVTGKDVPKPTAQLTAGEYTVWVIDATSASQAGYAAVVQAFKASHTAKLLYLISSGFKQEQLGSDRNQYGTVRAFTDKSDEGEDLLTKITEAIRGSEMPLSAVAQIYRRVMKGLGAVPRNRNILAGASMVPQLVATLSEEVSTEEEELNAEFLVELHREDLFEAFVTALRREPGEVAQDLAPEDGQDHASSHINTPLRSDKASTADRQWFDVQENMGGGDCLLHALSGRDLTFEEVIVRRGALADALPDDERMSGDVIYQTLFQSGYMNGAMHEEMQGRHDVPRATMQSLVRVPGMYAGDMEIQAFCRMNPDTSVYVVTHAGELRWIRADGTETVTTVAASGAAELRAQVQLRLGQPNTIVLYQSPNHWEKIRAVKVQD